MKEMMPAAGKWILLACIFAILGVFLLFGLGRCRGTRLYRVRMSLWRLALALTAGGGMVMASMSGGCKSETPKDMCYKTVPVMEPAPDAAAASEDAVSPAQGQDAVTTEQEEEKGAGPGEEETAASAAQEPRAPAKPVNKNANRPGKKKKPWNKDKITCYVPFDD